MRFLSFSEAGLWLTHLIPAFRFRKSSAPLTVPILAGSFAGSSAGGSPHHSGNELKGNQGISADALKDFQDLFLVPAGQEGAYPLEPRAPLRNRRSEALRQVTVSKAHIPAA